MTTTTTPRRWGDAPPMIRDCDVTPVVAQAGGRAWAWVSDADAIRVMGPTGTVLVDGLHALAVGVPVDDRTNDDIQRDVLGRLGARIAAAFQRSSFS